jgi:hypothetical protein
MFPLYLISELELTNLVGANERVDQNDYGASVAITLGDGVLPVSGELLSFMFYSTETGTGAVQTPAGTLLLLDVDPAVAAGDTALTAAEHITILGRVDVTAGDWLSDANGGHACIVDQPIAFHSLTTLYAVWFHTDATSMNDGAGDDEALQFNAWFRRDS